MPFFSPPLPAFVWRSPVLLASFSFLLPVFFSSLSLLLCPAFLFLKAGTETDEDDRCWSFCAQPMVAASRDSETDRPRRFWSLFVFSPSSDAFSRDDEDDGDEGVLCWWSCRLPLCFSLLSTVSFLWLSLPCLSLVSSCLSFLVFLCSLLSFSLFLLCFSLFSTSTVNLPYLTVTLANERNSLFSAFFYSVFGCFFFFSLRFSPLLCSFFPLFFCSFLAAPC